MKDQEQENYECFGIPAHVWSDPEVIAEVQPPGWPRRNRVYREAAMLGAEAMPSPLIHTT